MLPPLDPALLEQNPRFRALYENLTSAKLDSDGSTKDSKKQKARAVLQEALSIQQELQNSHVEVTKATILHDSLKAVASTSTDLPPELCEVIEIICAQLSGLVPPSDEPILENDIQYFIDNIHPISIAVSAYLSSAATHIATVALAAHPQGFPSPDPPSSSHLLNLASTLQHSITAQSSKLGARRLQVANLAAEVSAAHRALLEAVVRVLEQTVHGSVARASRARAEHLAVVARGMELKMSILSQTQPIDPALTSALQNYSSHLEKTRAELQARVDKAKTTLRRYDEAGPGMSDLAARYAKVCAEIEDVRSEINRLNAKN